MFLRKKSAAFVPRAGRHAFGDNADKFAFVPDLHCISMELSRESPVREEGMTGFDSR